MLPRCLPLVYDFRQETVLTFGSFRRKKNRLNTIFGGSLCSFLERNGSCFGVLVIVVKMVNPHSRCFCLWLRNEGEKYVYVVAGRCFET